MQHRGVAYGILRQQVGIPPPNLIQRSLVLGARRRNSRQCISNLIDSHRRIGDARAFIASLRVRKVRYADHPHKKAECGGLSPSTIHAYVRCLKVFGSWLFDEDFLTAKPFARLKRPNLPQPVIARPDVPDS